MKRTESRTHTEIYQVKEVVNSQVWIGNIQKPKIVYIFVGRFFYFKLRSFLEEEWQTFAPNFPFLVVFSRRPDPAVRHSD